MIFRKFILLAVLMSASCAPKRMETAVTVDDDGNISQATLPNGAVANGPDEYEAAIAEQVPPVEEMGTFALTVQGNPTDGGKKGVDIGKFNISIVPDANYLNGCIRHSFLHLKIVVTNTKINMGAMVELHILAWFESGQPCFAVMNTGFIGYGWCQKMCMKDVKKGVAKTVAGGLVAAGITPVIAAIIAQVTAPVATVALAL